MNDYLKFQNVFCFYILILWYDLNQISAVCGKQFLFYYYIFVVKVVKVLNIIIGILFYSDLRWTISWKYEITIWTLTLYTYTYDVIRITTNLYAYLLEFI